VAALRSRGHGGGTDALLLGVNFAAVAALVASFFGGLFASSRMLFHLAREGVLPRSLARTNARHAPWLAVLAAAGAAAILTYIGSAEQLVVLLVFGATTCYLLILAAHWRLRHVAPEVPRPYRSCVWRIRIYGIDVATIQVLRR
jgi:amino acid transporter